MWTRLVLIAPDSETAQHLAEDLFALGASGCEIRDAETFSELADSAFEAARGSAVELIAYLPEGSEAPAASALLARYPGARVVGVQPFDDRTWRESWRQFFAPLRVSPRLTVRPSWNSDLPPGSHHTILIIDPGMAFGTGTHETTRLCLGAIDAWLGEHPGASLLDVGCGSGILTMAAHCLGAGRILGIDNDPEALRVARENWVVNQLGEAPEAPFSSAPLASLETGWEVVVANILSRILETLRPQLARLLAPGGRLLASGVLVEERDRFIGAFAQAPLSLVEEWREGEWMAFALERS